MANSENRIQQMVQMEVAALETEIDSLRKELFNLKVTAASGQVKDYSQFKKLRRDIARGLTVLKNRLSDDSSAVAENEAN